MRHGIAGRKLNRKTSHRIALLKNLSKSLIVNEQIETTLPKAKDLRPFVEKILTMGKSNTLHSKRKVLAYLGDQSLVNKVFDVLAKRYSKRNGGYVRIIKSGFRYGDSAPKAIIELVERDTDAKGKIDKDKSKIKEQLKEQGAAVQTSETKNLESSKPKITEKKSSEPNTDKKKEK
tara:strand:+ start:87 stop:614 length:528 start_codon:yes stop_codon:yes gene_type:complete